MKQYHYLIKGNPVDLARLKTGRSYSWTDTKAKIWELEIMLAEQNKDQQVLTHPLHLEVLFYFPLLGQFNREKKEGAYYAQKPTLYSILKGLLPLFVGRICATECLIVTINAKKFYSEIPRTECIFSEMI
jgi:Holliday junction resolvase RusA-like endonuclease